MKCLIDNQLPASLARFLASRGVESIHVTDVGLAQAGDREIWKYSLEQGYILVTKDDDFLDISSHFLSKSWWPAHLGAAGKLPHSRAFSCL